MLCRVKIEIIDFTPTALESSVLIHAYVTHDSFVSMKIRMKIDLKLDSCKPSDLGLCYYLVGTLGI